MSALLEIAAFGLEAAIIADRAGADRIELCVDYAHGGLTPPLEMITAATNQLSCPVFVMIRPRPGDFMYSATELEQMKQILLGAKTCGAHGLVFGMLKADGEIDEAACSALLALAAPLPCTFHRAFDDLKNKHASLETLIRCGFSRILTSGGPGSAAAHTDVLKSLVAQSASRIVVMPGGGVRPTNLAGLAATTNATEYHSAAITGLTDLPDVESIADMKHCLRDFAMGVSPSPEEGAAFP